MMRTRLAFGAGLIALLGTACSADPTPVATAAETPGLVSVTSNVPTYTAPKGTYTPPAPTTDNEFPSSMLDTLFLQNLRDGGVLYAEPNQTVNLARTVCAAFDAGVGWHVLGLTLADSMTLWDDSDTGWFMGSAIAAYCPEHESVVPA